MTRQSVPVQRGFLSLGGDALFAASLPAAAACADDDAPGDPAQPRSTGPGSLGQASWYEGAVATEIGDAREDHKM